MNDKQHFSSDVTIRDRDWLQTPQSVKQVVSNLQQEIEQLQQRIVELEAELRHIIGTRPLSELSPDDPKGLIDNAPPVHVFDDALPEAPPEVGVLKFQVLGHTQYHVHRWDAPAILGRRDLGQPMPDSRNLIDLASYFAQSLGVSRQHALIDKEREHYVLYDLRSTNGTFLNYNRLQPEQAYPLKNGDQIKLGKLIMFIYFQLDVDETA